MALRLDPGIPLLWRTPSSLQLGVETAPIVLEGVGDPEQLLLEALRRGATRQGLDLVAAELGLDPGAVVELLARVGPALLGERARPTAGALVLGEGELAHGIAGALREAGLPPDTGRLGLVVLVAPWLIPPAESGRWLRRDIPHLPVLLADGAVTVGPLVRPGRAPCLHCVDRARIDADPAWTAMAAQLLDRPAPPLSRLQLAEALAFATRAAIRAVRGEQATGVARRLELADGTLSERTWAPHPDCRCSAPQGSDWASAADPPHPETLGHPGRPLGTRSATLAVARG